MQSSKQWTPLLVTLGLKALDRKRAAPTLRQQKLMHVQHFSDYDRLPETQNISWSMDPKQSTSPDVPTASWGIAGTVVVRDPGSNYTEEPMGSMKNIINTTQIKILNRIYGIRFIDNHL
jgi:hypothetical protein